MSITKVQTKKKLAGKNSQIWDKYNWQLASLGGNMSHESSNAHDPQKIPLSWRIDNIAEAADSLACFLSFWALPKHFSFSFSASTITATENVNLETSNR